MTHVSIPELETRRLRLVPLSAYHSEGMFELWSSPEVCRYCPQAVDTEGRKIVLPVAKRDESGKIIDFFLDYAAKGKGFRWAMIERATGAFVGALGFNALGNVSELAYHQVLKFWGQGLMAEACVKAIEWNQKAIISKHIEAFIEKENQPSIKLAERLGFRKTDTIREGATRYVL